MIVMRNSCTRTSKNCNIILAILCSRAMKCQHQSRMVEDDDARLHTLHRAREALFNKFVLCVKSKSIINAIFIYLVDLDLSSSNDKTRCRDRFLGNLERGVSRATIGIDLAALR